MGFNCLKGRATSRRQVYVYFLPLSSQKCLVLILLTSEGLSRPWGHPVVLNSGPLDCESSALTTSLACKCVYYRPEHNAKGEPRETEF